MKSNVAWRHKTRDRSGMTLEGDDAGSSQRGVKENIEENGDILFLQEVTSTAATNMRGYVTHHNIGTVMHDTAVVTKNGITLNNVFKLPSGRAIAAEYRGTWLINIYAPSGTARRHEREKFYNSDLPYLLRSSQARMILGGDFNCVLANSDTTDQYHYSRGLAELTHGFAIQDTWQQNPASPTYTHQSITGAMRIDRLYTTQEMLAKKLTYLLHGAESFLRS